MDPNEHLNGSEPVKRTSPVTVALAWALVSVLLGFGLQDTIRRALQLLIGE